MIAWLGDINIFICRQINSFLANSWPVNYTQWTTSVPKENDCLHKSNSGSAELYEEVYVTAGTEVQKIATEGNSINIQIDLHKDSI